MTKIQFSGKPDAHAHTGKPNGRFHPLRQALRAGRFVAHTCVLLALLPSAAQAFPAAPADQDFDAIEAGTTSEINGTLTFGGIVYSTDAVDDQLAVDTISNITGALPSVGSGNGLTAVWLGSNTGTYLQFAAVDSAENFRIISFNAEVWGHNSLNSEVYTITGFDDGVEAASATVNFRVTATYGTGSSAIDYLRLTTPEESTSSGDGANAGTLTFSGDGWSNVDRIRISVADEEPNTILGVSIDNVAFAEAVVPVTDLAGNELIGLPYTSSESYFFDPNDAPTDITLANSSVNQSGGENATVGGLTTTDADEADTHLLSLVAGEGDTDNALFNISENLLRANDASALEAGDYSVRIRTADNDEATFEKVFVVSVIDDIAPVITSLATAGGTYGSAFGYTITASGGATGFGATGLPTGLSVDAGTGEISGSPSQTGVFNVQLSATDAAENADTQTLEITVGKAAASIELAGLAPTYDGSAKAASATTTPDGLSVAFTYDGEVATPTVAGNYAVVATINDENFTGTANGTLIIGKAALIATADDASRAYGAVDPEFTGSFTGAVEGDNLSVTYDTTATTTSAVGDYDIVPAINDPDEKLGNYSVTLNNGTLTVDKAVIVAKADDQTRAYGVANPELTISYTGFVNDETVESLDELPVAATVATAASAVGDHDITLSGGLDGNYAFDPVTGTLTVTPAALIATADDASRAYGAVNPEFTGSFTGAVEGDNLSVTYDTSAIATSAVGTYDIVPAINDPDTKLGNYSVTLNNGTLTVDKAVIVAKADDQTRAYGVANPELTISYSGFVNDETVEALDELPVAATLATAASAVGDHDITLSGGLDGNYTFDPVTGTLTVTPATLIATADDAGRAYGAVNPEFTGSFTGAVEGDNLSVTYDTSATATSAVGTYDIVPAINDPDTKLGNYSVTLNNGTMTVDKAVIVATADDQTRAYGAANPELTISYTGFANDETVEALDELPVAATVATAASAVGDHDITLSGGLDGNYTFDPVTGTLTVTPAALIATADDASRAYGAVNPEFTGSFTGAVEGDNLSVTYDTSATATSAVGTYDIVPAINDPDEKLGNYAVTLNNGTLTVTGDDDPVLALGAANRVYTLGDAPVLLAPVGTVSDGGSEDFGGGQLSVTVIDPLEETIGDRLVLAPDEDETIGLNLNNGMVSLGALHVANASGGIEPGLPLTVGFNSSATPEIVQSVLRRLAFSTTNNLATRTLVFALTDGDGGTAEPVEMSVEINRRPLVVRDPLVLATNTTLTVALTLLSDNDSDPDGDTFSLVEIDGVSEHGGTVTVEGGMFSYTPVVDYAGVDTLTYLVRDARGGEATGTVQLKVLGEGKLAMLPVVDEHGAPSDEVKLFMGSNQPGRVFDIEASNDFETWTFIGKGVVSEDGLLEFLDAAPQTQNHRFYRLLTP